MESKSALPIIKKREKIDKKKFIALAKKVKKIFEEEAKYLEKIRKDENINSRRFLLDS